MCISSSIKRVYIFMVGGKVTDGNEGNASKTRENAVVDCRDY